MRNCIETKLCISKIAPAEHFLNRVLSLTHPSLFRQASKCLSELRSHPDTQSVARTWTSVFSGIAVIANRVTPKHIDRFGAAPWYDSLASVGTFSKATLDLPGLGISLSYAPGTVVNLCGNVIEHEVKRWGSDDRVCYAHFMRRAVFDRFGVASAAWVKQVDYDGLADALVRGAV
ncbi:hypothetical protein Hypma_013175 [Hypsizygus marmoreus]|uniref:2OGFeDO JBP1/TET oxygenase domain-containing protein n=1 Tax=Hypsizygus marmoreus TaxID=39966 RepID=A0A369JEJ1_HYPMA|nr:hypothetical protein Hypma_013175 [Hypsizygus marmoreus]